MKTKKTGPRIRPLCSKCPYKLGLVHTLTNPCPQCKKNGYGMFERFWQKTASDGRKTERG